MRITSSIATGGYLLAAAMFLVGCADKQATSPDESPLDLTRAPSFNVAVASTIETTDPETGTVSRREFTQKGKAKPHAGEFRANIAPIGDPNAPYDPAVTPVVALETDALWSDYDETFVDSASGSLIHIIARGPGNGSPVDNVWVWVDGQPRVRMNWVWRPAVGGWTLYRQTITGLPYNYEPTIRIVSVVNSSNNIYASNGFGARLGSVSATALDKIACWLGPKVAYANIAACWHQAAIFAGETFGLGVGTVLLVPNLPAFINPWAIGAYFTGWGLWTDSLYSLLDCLDRQPTRKSKRPARTEVTNQFGF